MLSVVCANTPNLPPGAVVNCTLGKPPRPGNTAPCDSDIFLVPDVLELLWGGLAGSALIKFQCSLWKRDMDYISFPDGSQEICFVSLTSTDVRS